MYRYITAMSKSQQKIYDEVEHASKQIDKHIIRLLLYPDAQECNHWMNEIVSFLSDVDLLKGKNKWPSKKLLLKALETHNDILDRYRWQVQEAEDELVARNVRPDVIYRSIRKYQDWLATELSTNGVISSHDAKDMLRYIVQSTL